MKEKYGAALRDGTKYKIAKPTGEYAHENFPEIKEAVDFIIPVGTEIIAVKGGKVVESVSDSDRYGLDVKPEDANRVTIDHGDGTYSEYAHFGKDKVSVKEGQSVRKGESLGYSGLSGIMDKPHLHLNIAKIEDGKAVSIPYVNELPEIKKGNGGLEKALGALFIVSIGIVLVSFSGITGAVIGNSGSNFYGMVPLVVGLLALGVWMFLRKKI